jgi:hypothetical protein
MYEPLNADTWVWVIVMDPEAKPQYLGQQQEGTDVAFIPTFRSKEDAQQGLAGMTLEKGRKIEIQAIMYDHLCEDAAANGFHLFVIDAEGNIAEKIAPGAGP